jgi:hypothetical protein
MDRTITVWGRPHTVRVAQSSRVSWVANAEYGGEMLYGHGANPAAALAKWASAAKSKGQARA